MNSHSYSPNLRIRDIGKWIGTLLLVSVSITAQNGSGVSGMIYDIQGAVVPGRSVTAIDQKGKDVGSVTSDERGKYFINLSPGIYSFEVRDKDKKLFSGFCRVIVKNYRVVGTASMKLDIVLPEVAASHDGPRCRTKIIKY